MYLRLYHEMPKPQPKSCYYFVHVINKYSRDIEGLTPYLNTLTNNVNLIKTIPIYSTEKIVCYSCSIVYV